MSPEKQCITIAEVCGLNPYRWTFTYRHEEGSERRAPYESLEQAQREWREIYNGPQYAQPIERIICTPDYLGDLNAIHAAIQAQPLQVQWMVFAILADITDAKIPAFMGTAAQYCEALLKALGKWEKEKS